MRYLAFAWPTEIASSPLSSLVACADTLEGLCTERLMSSLEFQDCACVVDLQEGLYAELMVLKGELRISHGEEENEFGFRGKPELGRTFVAALRNEGLDVVFS